MKKKSLLILLCSCMLLSACGINTTTNSGNTAADITITTDTPEEDKNSTVSDEAATTKPSAVDDDFSADIIPTGDVSETGDTYQTQISLPDPTTLTTEYDRAAYFADSVYNLTQGNTLVSPLSLNIALGLAAEGASGETAEELYAYLGNPDFSKEVSEYLAYAASLARDGDTSANSMNYWGGYTFRYDIANSVWVNQNRKLTQSYKDRTMNLFSAEVQSVDFEGNVAHTADIINDWCNLKTKGMIPTIVNAETLSPNTAAVLLNTVYFESPWVEKWGKQKHTFTDFGKHETTQEMLFDTLDTYFENDQATAFAKPYYNGFEFIGILPKTTDEFTISDLDLESLLNSRTGAYDVKSIMPKLNFDTTADQIIPILREQGMKLPFDNKNAQFDKMIEMNDDEVTYISEIIQKCKIELDENGTKAAAATAITMCYSSACIEMPPVKEVYLNRPFAFMIYDKTNEKIVFVGKVTTVE